MGEDEEELEVERETVSFGEHAFQFEKFEQVSSSSLAAGNYERLETHGC